MMELVYSAYIFCMSVLIGVLVYLSIRGEK